MVTVLFADLVGFTTLAEERDPEAVKELLDRCFGALVPVIEVHGGRVDKIIGDELMAVFGAPLAHEDDPERAVRAADSLHRALADLAPELHLRIGVNSGEVLAGPVGPQRAYTVTGDTVNTAHRLASAAEAGETLVGERVQVATAHVVDYRERPPFELRGKHAPVRAWSAGGMRAANTALDGVGATAASSVLVGRDVELAQVLALADRAVATRTPTMVVMTGEPGVGKTRLAAELKERFAAAHPTGQVLRVRCAPYGSGQALAPIAELVRIALGLDPARPDELERTLLAERLAPVAAAAGVDADLLTARIATLVDLDAPEARSADATGPVRLRPGDQLVSAARSVLQARVADGPVVLVVDDAQWADDAVLEALERLVTKVGSVRLVVLVLGREELLERRRWRGREAPHTTLLSLPPLAPGPARALLASLLQAHAPAGPALAVAGLGPEAERRILAAAGGNPLLLGQLVSSLVEQGALAVVGDRWHATVDLEQIALPEDSRALISTRLDGLPSAEREVVFAAAIVGPRFWIDVVGELIGAPVSTDVLGALVARGLVEPVTGAPDETDHAFAHTLTREVAYAATAMADRAAKHAQVAAWLERRFPTAPGRVAGHLAQHYERAVVYAHQLDHTDPGLADLAFAAMVRAAEEAERHDALHTADRWFARAREFAGPATERAEEVAFAHGRVLVALRRLEPARQTFAEVRRRAGTADEALVASATSWLATAARLQGDLIDARDAFDEAQERWRAMGDVAGEAETLWLQGWSELIVGRARAALPKLRRAAELEEHDGPRGVTLQALGWSEYVVGELEAARQHLWQAADVHLDEGDPGGAGWCFGILGFTFLVTGQSELAVQTAENLIALAQVHGESWSEASCLVLLAGAHVLAGDVEAARQRADEALAAFEEFDAPWGAVMSRLMAARAARAAGDLAGARLILREGLAVCQRVSHVGEEPRLLVELAQVDLDDGAAEDAGRRARSALSLTRAGFGDHDSGARALLVLARLAEDAGDPAAAQLLLEEVIDGIDRQLPTDAWRQANAQLASLLVAHGDLAAARRLVDAAAAGAQESIVADVQAGRSAAALHLAAGDDAGAVRALDRLLERHGDRDLPVLQAARADRGALATVG